MKLALVTAPSGGPRDAGASTCSLLRELRELCEIQVFVERGREGADLCGHSTHSSDALRPREFDQVLYTVANDARHGYMARMVRELGGAVALAGWVLHDLALAAHPELARAGWRGLATAVREGGLAQARRWRAGRRAGRDEPDLALNRSIVRFADAFVVGDGELARRILDERNAPTPIAVVPAPSGGDWSATARVYAEALAAFPRPRGARSREVFARVLEGVRARRR